MPLSRDIWAEAGFKCDKALVLRERIKETLCISIMNCFRSFILTDKNVYTFALFYVLQAAAIDVE